MTGRLDHLRAQCGRIGSVQLTEGGDRGGDLPDAQLAVGHPGQGGTAVEACRVRPSPPP